MAITCPIVFRYFPLLAFSSTILTNSIRLDPLVLISQIYKCPIFSFCFFSISVVPYKRTSKNRATKQIARVLSLRRALVRLSHPSINIRIPHPPLLVPHFTYFSIMAGGNCESWVSGFFSFFFQILVKIVNWTEQKNEKKRTGMNGGDGVGKGPPFWQGLRGVS